MDAGKRPSRPVVATLAGALAAIDAWLEENQYDSLRDGDGHRWQLKTEATVTPVPGEPQQRGWRVQLRLSTTATAAQLTGTGVLDAAADARLLGLIGDAAVPLTMKPRAFDAPNEDEARLKLAAELPPLKAELAAKSLISIKRELVGRWVDERGRFGAESS